MIALILSFLMSVSQPADEPSAKFRMCWKICPGHTGLCYTGCKIFTCSPCLYGCTDNVCNDEPHTDEDGFPVTAAAAMEAGYGCRATDHGGECDNGYEWACDELSCVDIDGGQWRAP